MLVLSRHRDESIDVVLADLIPLIAADPQKLAQILSSPLSFTVVDIRGDKVRVGVDAPTEIPVHRREVYNAIQRESGKGGRPEKRAIHG